MNKSYSQSIHSVDERERQRESENGENIIGIVKKFILFFFSWICGMRPHMCSNFNKHRLHVVRSTRTLSDQKQVDFFPFRSVLFIHNTSNFIQAAMSEQKIYGSSIKYFY